MPAFHSVRRGGSLLLRLIGPPFKHLAWPCSITSGAPALRFAAVFNITFRVLVFWFRDSFIGVLVWGSVINLRIRIDANDKTTP